MEARKSIASNDVGRVIAVSACCLLAAIAPFIAGVSTAPLGLVPLGLAIWLVMRSRWSGRTQVTAVLAAVAVTVALVIVLLALVLRYANN